VGHLGITANNAKRTITIKMAKPRGDTISWRCLRRVGAGRDVRSVTATSGVSCRIVGSVCGCDVADRFFKPTVDIR
jgi:hypothetical protein